MTTLQDLLAEALKNRPSNGIIGAAGRDPGSDPSLLPRPGDPYIPPTREDEDRRTLQQKVYEILTSLDRGLESMVPPNSREQVRSLGQLAQMLHPAGDVIDARQNFEDAAEAAREGDALGAASSAGWGALSGIGLSELSQPLQSILAGVAADTADLRRFREANKLDRRGASDVQTWRKTGWARGIDDQWRWEIDDSDSLFRLDPNALRSLDAGTTTRLENLLHHPKLYEAYKDFKDVPVIVTGGKDAAYSPSEDAIYLGRSTDSPLKALLHEAQHRVQVIEGFEFGMSGHEAAMIAKTEALDAKLRIKSLLNENPDLAELERQYNKTKNSRTRAKLLAHPRYIELVRLQRQLARATPRRVYRETAGEVEPRNVEARLDKSPEYNRKVPPRITEDTPRELQRLQGTARSRFDVKPGL